MPASKVEIVFRASTSAFDKRNISRCLFGLACFRSLRLFLWQSIRPFRLSAFAQLCRPRGLLILQRGPSKSYDQLGKTARSPLLSIQEMRTSALSALQNARHSKTMKDLEFRKDLDLRNFCVSEKGNIGGHCSIILVGWCVWSEKLQKWCLPLGHRHSLWATLSNESNALKEMGDLEL